MNHTPTFPPRLACSELLPASKSISNRAMVICALSNANSGVENLATCDDTYVMWRALTRREPVIDVMAAGTAMRFLTAYFSVCNGEEHVITGTERMRQRPIAPLVEALRAVGADISYVDREGFPPLRVRGGHLDGGMLTIASDVSSQYISAILMVAPFMRQGLTLQLRGPVVSRPYIDMTLAMMQRTGVRAQWLAADMLRVEPGGYAGSTVFEVEGDWSAASYWYEMVALSPDPEARVTLRRLCRVSLQGDAAVQQLFRPLGVATTFDDDHHEVVLTKCGVPADVAASPFCADLMGCPDLAQTLVVTCAMLRRPFRFTGLQSLRIKETDRMEALRAELEKFGLTLGIAGDSELFMDSFPEGTPRWDGRPIATYKDHRMAMSFAPAAMLCPGLSIADPSVVSKSYPSFWKRIENL